MTTDAFTVRTVALGLMAAALAVIVGGIVLAYQSKAIPDALIALGSGALGAGASLLARTSSSDTQAVEVVNHPSDPVPVDAG